MTFFKLYLISFIVFFAIDLIWLGLLAKNLYREQLGSLMSDEIKWQPAILFYGLYIAGLVFFAVLPGFTDGSSILTLLYGLFFGLVCYATYDLTNLATLKNWPTKIAVYDILWGAFSSGLTSFITFWIGSWWKSYYS